MVYSLSELAVVRACLKLCTWLFILLRQNILLGCNSYVCFLVPGAGVNVGPGPLPTSMPVVYSMQRAPMPGHSTGHRAQFLSSVGPVPQASYSEQALQVGMNYLQQVPLPGFRKPGTVYVCIELGEIMFPKLSLFIPNRGQLPSASSKGTTGSWGHL